MIEWYYVVLLIALSNAFVFFVAFGLGSASAQNKILGLKFEEMTERINAVKEEYEQSKRSIN